MTLPTLVHVADPLCGWCFAFADTAKALREHFAGEVAWEIACGGLVTGERVAPIAQAAGYLRSGMRSVEARTPARFGQAFHAVIDEGSWVSNSEPACRASLMVQELWGGEVAVDFASALSVQFYGHGRVPDDAQTLAMTAEEVGVDPEKLLEGWDTDEARAMTQRAFKSARAQRMTSYPSLYMRRAAGTHAVIPGWLGAKDAIRTVRAALEGVTS